VSSLIWPSDSIGMIGLPPASVTACSFEFRPSFVGPIRRAPFFCEALLPCRAREWNRQDDENHRDADLANVRLMTASGLASTAFNG